LTDFGGAVLLLRVILRERRLDNELSQQIGPARRANHPARFEYRNLFDASVGESFEQRPDIIGQFDSQDLQIFAHNLTKLVVPS
jgi:hypothetical protein